LVARLPESRSPPFFAYTEGIECGHGRLDERTVKGNPFEPAEADLAFARTLAVVARKSTAFDKTVAF